MTTKQNLEDLLEQHQSLTYSIFCKVKEILQSFGKDVRDISIKDDLEYLIFFLRDGACYRVTIEFSNAGEPLIFLYRTPNLMYGRNNFWIKNSDQFKRFIEEIIKDSYEPVDVY